jgi:hypothetical protein
MLWEFAQQRWRRFLGIAERAVLGLAMTLIVVAAEQLLSRRAGRKGPAS